MINFLYLIEKRLHLRKRKVKIMDRKEAWSYDDNYRGYKRIFKWFKDDYPDLWVRGTTFLPHGYQEILVVIPRKGRLIYNSVGVEGTKIRWIDGPYEDERIIKQQEREARPEMYQNFLREIDHLQRMTGLTQADISRMTGISRKSINKYLSGVVPPKVSTMRKIAETLSIDI